MDPSSLDYLSIPLFVADDDVVKETVGSLLRSKHRLRGSLDAALPPPPAPRRSVPVSLSPAPDSEEEEALQMPASASINQDNEGDFAGYAAKVVPRPPGVRFDPRDDEDVEISVIRKVPAAARRGEMGPMAYNPKLRGPGVPGPQDFYSAASVAVPPAHRVPPPNHPSRQVVISAPQKHDENKDPKGMSCLLIL